MTPVLGAEVGVEVDGWQGAIRAACQPLLDGGAIEQRYVERCVEMVVSHGPYMVVAPGIALAHARPEDGAVRLGLAVAILAQAVEFGHEQNDPVDLVFAFASPDRDQHVHLLAVMAQAIGGGLAEALRRADDRTAAHSTLEEAVSGV